MHNDGPSVHKSYQVLVLLERFLTTLYRTQPRPNCDVRINPPVFPVPAGITKAAGMSCICVSLLAHSCD